MTLEELSTGEEELSRDTVVRMLVLEGSSLLEALLDSLLDDGEAEEEDEEAAIDEEGDEAMLLLDSLSSDELADEL